MIQAPCKNPPRSQPEARQMGLVQQPAVRQPCAAMPPAKPSTFLAKNHSGEWETPAGKPGIFEVPAWSSSIAPTRAKLAAFCHVLEHEIGHVMIGDGHADCGTSLAMLRWTKRQLSEKHPSMDPRDQQRLMCSGPGTNWDQPGKQLIYKEWSLIETWLLNEEIHQRLP